MAYKQKIIPVVDDVQFQGMRLGEVKLYVKQYFNLHLNGKSVINQSKGFSVKFQRNGLKHIIHARSGGFTKYKAILCMDEMVKYGEYTNFKPETTTPSGIIGYLHLKSKVKIENKIHTFRIIVRMTKEGKFYYDHSIRIRK
jgi:hypothetical protein